MAIRLRIGQEIPNGLRRLIKQALHPKDFRHKGAAQGRIVHPGPRDFGPLHGAGGAPLDASGVGQRFAVLTKEIERDTDYPIRRCHREGIGRACGNRLIPARKSKSALEVQGDGKN
jgi:hypothetical protein